MASAASAIERHPGWQNHVSNAKLVGESLLPQSRKGWMIVFITFLTFAILPAAFYVSSSWYKHQIEQAHAAGKLVAQQAAQAEIARLRAQVKQLDADLRAEIKVKQAFAVRVARAEAKTGQAVDDLKTVVVATKQAAQPIRKRDKK